MVDWAKLQHAYGSAENLPAEIRSWIECDDDESRIDLWGALCHQETVYSASFEAIKLLVAACAAARPKRRREALMLIGAIWASEDRYQNAAPSQEISDLIPHVDTLAENALGDRDMDEYEFAYMVQAIASLRGTMFWRDKFGDFSAGEFDGVCPRCNCDLFISVGEWGCYVCDHNKMFDPMAARSAIETTQPDALPDDVSRLYDICQQHDRAEISLRVLRLFGSSSCPNCHAKVGLIEAYKKSFDPRPPRLRGAGV